MSILNSKILIATHGDFAKGIYDSLRLIAGEQENVECLCAYTEIIDLSAYVEEYMHTFDFSSNNLVVVTDLLGGSVNNEFMKYIHKYDFHLVSGLNLALLLELVTRLEALDQEKIMQIVLNSREYTRYCHQSVLGETNEEEF